MSKTYNAIICCVFCIAILSPFDLYSCSQDSLIINSDLYIKNLKDNNLLVDDAEAVDYLQCIVNNLRFEDENKFEVLILNSIDINASIFPNKKIIITSGMLLKLGNESEMAFVLSHEIAHYLLKHHLSLVRDERKEYEADSLGVSIFSNSGYDGVDAIKALQKIPVEVDLKWILGDVIKYKNIEFRTHPRTADRLRRLSKLVKEPKMELVEYCGDYHDKLSKMLDKTKMDIYISSDHKGTLGIQIAIVDSIIYNMRVVNESNIEKYHFLLFTQSDAIITLISLERIEMSYHLSMAEAYFDYRISSSKSEEDFFSVERMFKKSKSKEVGPVLDNLKIKLKENIDILSSTDLFRVESIRLLGLMHYLNKEKNESINKLNEYFSFNPTSSRRRYARSVLSKLN